MPYRMLTSAIRKISVSRLTQGQAPQRLATAANLLLVILLAVTLAQLTWRLAPQPSLPQAVSVQRPAVQAGPGPKRVNTTELAQWHLFGEQEAQAPAPNEHIAAPDTKLNLNLRGVIASSAPEDARAIVADSGGEEKTYAVGDALPGGAKLHEIYPDRVILLRANRYETLRLPRELADVKVNSDEQPDAQNPAPDSSQVTKNIRTALLQETQQPRRGHQVMNMLPLEPIRKGGRITGYRIKPGPKAKSLAQVGLAGGDVITGIDGLSMDDPKPALRHLSSLSLNDNINISLLRNGQPLTVVVRFSEVN